MAGVQDFESVAIEDGDDGTGEVSSECGYALTLSPFGGVYGIGGTSGCPCSPSPRFW